MTTINILLPFLYKYGVITLSLLLISVVIAFIWILKRNKKRRFLLSILSIIGLLNILAIVLILGPLNPIIDSVGKVDHKVGKTYDQFSFQILHHEKKQISSFRGKVLLLNFWGTYCPPCIRELSSFKKIESAYSSKVAVVCLTDEPPSTVIDFVSKRSDIPSMIGFYDKKDWIDLKTFRPLTILIDEKGIIRQYFVGELTYTQLNSIIRKLQKQ